MFRLSVDFAKRSGMIAIKFKPETVSQAMRSVSLPSLLLTLTGLAVVSGCTTASRTAGGGLLSPKPSSSANYITALQGGIVARSGAELSSSDRSRALEVEYRVLEEAAGGQAMPWKGDGASGVVVANAPYQVGAQNCRQYRHTVTVNGKEMMARGAACRNSDGTWTPLT
jgi:surface antigen